MGCVNARVLYIRDLINPAADIEEEDDEAEEGGDAAAGNGAAVKTSAGNLDSVVIASGGGKSDPTASDHYFMDRHGSLELLLG